MLATNSRGQNLENLESGKNLILEEDILAANCFENDIRLYDNLPIKDSEFPLQSSLPNDNQNVQPLVPKILLVENQLVTD